MFEKTATARFSRAEEGMTRFPPNVEQVSVGHDSNRTWPITGCNDVELQFPESEGDCRHPSPTATPPHRIRTMRANWRSSLRTTIGPGQRFQVAWWPMRHPAPAYRPVSLGMSPAMHTPLRWVASGSLRLRMPTRPLAESPQESGQSAAGPELTPRQRDQ